MSPMVERVARALEQGVCGACGRPAVGQITPQDCDRRPECRWDRGTPEQQARAAIEAMREPTKEMVDVYMDLEPMDDEYSYNPPAAIPAWRAMIDAALKP